jgi:hypothetical protein
MAGTVVLGEAGILSVGALGCLRVMQTVAPRQRKSAKVGDNPVQLTFVTMFNLLFEDSEGNPTGGLTRLHHCLELVLERLVVDLGIAESH